MRLLRATVVLVLLALVSGCGYHIAGKGGKMPGDIKVLSIPVFNNTTLKPDIESIVTAAFVNEFVTAVKVQDNAPNIMVGAIKVYNLTPVSYSKTDVNQEYRLTVSLDLAIYEEGTGVLVWKEENIVNYADFAVNISDVAATKDREADALRTLSRDTARLIKERMLENF